MTTLLQTRTLDTAPMSPAQMRAVAVGVAINAVDGYDIVSISFAAPGIAKDWGIGLSGLGFVLSMELIGAGLGSLLLGSLADRFGRRPMLLACQVATMLGMLACTQAENVTSLAIFRIVVGLGIGGLLPALTSMVTESSNQGARNMSITLLSAGYTIGAVLGGSVAAWLLAEGSWHGLFLFGAACTLAVLLATAVWVPETVAFLTQRRPPGALGRANATLARFRLSPIDALPMPSLPGRATARALLSGDLLRNAVVLPLIFLLHFATFYFPIKWVPKIVVDMGYAPAIGASVFIWINLGGLLGALVVAYATRRFNLWPLTALVLVAAAVMVTVFGLSAGDLSTLKAVGAVMGFLTNAGVGCIYAVLGRTFPAGVRGMGAGLSIGVGRVGAALSPIVAGYLFAAGFGLPIVAAAMALGSLLAAGMMLAVREVA